MDELSSVRSSLRVVSGDPLSLEVPAELFSPAEFAQFEGIVAVDEFECGPDSYRFSEPLSWHADVSNTGDALLVTGSVTGEARTDCARCLEDAVFDVEGEIEGYFLLDGAEIPEGADEDEFDRLPANHVLDMESLVVAAIVFELPLVPLCDEECRGLCPTCGANLNEGPCGCEKEQSDGPDEFELAKNPFAALANFSFDSDESAD